MKAPAYCEPHAFIHSPLLISFLLIGTYLFICFNLFHLSLAFYHFRKSRSLYTLVSVVFETQLTARSHMDYNGRSKAFFITNRNDGLDGLGAFCFKMYDGM